MKGRSPGAWILLLVLSGCGDDSAMVSDPSSPADQPAADDGTGNSPGDAPGTLDAGETVTDSAGDASTAGGSNDASMDGGSSSGVSDGGGSGSLDGGATLAPILALSADGVEAPLQFTNIVCTLPQGPFSAIPALTLRLDRFAPSAGSTTDDVPGSIQPLLRLEGAGPTFTGTATVAIFFYADNGYTPSDAAGLELSYSVSGVPDLGAPPPDRVFAVEGQLSIPAPVTLRPLVDVGDPELMLPAQELPFACQVARVVESPADASVMDPNADPFQPVYLSCDWDLTSPDRCPVCADTAVCDPPTYTDHGDGTVTSSCCDLVWQRDVEDRHLSWDESAAYCAGLELAGGGWRVPSVAELESLVVLGLSPPQPTVDRTVFPNTPLGFYWSSSASTTGGWPWAMHFYNGQPITFGTSTEGRVRCVK